MKLCRKICRSILGDFGLLGPFLADWSKGNLTQNSRIQSKPGIPEVVLYTFNFYVATHWDKRQLFIQKLPLVWCLKMWILWKMRLCKCEFCEKWDFENVNFMKNETLKMWFCIIADRLPSFAIQLRKIREIITESRERILRFLTNSCTSCISIFHYRHQQQMGGRGLFRQPTFQKLRFHSHCQGNIGPSQADAARGLPQKQFKRGGEQEGLWEFRETKETRGQGWWRWSLHQNR